MKSLLIAGVLLILFAWIHADKPSQSFSPDPYANVGMRDTTPLEKSKPGKKKMDSPERKTQFKDTSSMKKSRDSSYRKKMIDTPRPR
jgi:hypothetical protein